MINPNELRPGNYILFKTGVRIIPVSLTLEHFQLFNQGKTTDAFPIALKPETLLSCGFTENKKYHGLPQVREFVLTLPVRGSHKNEIYGYISSTENYIRASVNDIIISNHFYHLHQLQNLFYVLTGAELAVKL